MKLLHWNVRGPRFDYGKTWDKRRPKVVDQIKTIRPDVATIVECIGAPIAGACDMSSRSYQGSMVMWNPDTVSFSRELFVARWLGKTHGVIAVELVEKITGETFNVIAGHLPPFAWRAGLRKRLIADLIKRTDRWRDKTIVGLDANWGKGFEAYVLKSGWASARLHAGGISRGDYRTSGKWGKGQPIDYVLGRQVEGMVVFDEYLVAKALGGSDHCPVIVWL